MENNVSTILVPKDEYKKTVLNTVYIYTLNLTVRLFLFSFYFHYAVCMYNIGLP